MEIHELLSTQPVYQPGHRGPVVRGVTALEATLRDQPMSAEARKAQLEGASQEIWDGVAAISAHIAERAPQDVDVLSADALEDYGHLVGRFHLSDPTGLPGKIRGRFAREHKVAGWRIAGRKPDGDFDDTGISSPDRRYTQIVYLGEDGLLYVGHSMSKHDDKRGILLPDRIMKPGETFDDLLQCTELRDGLTALAMTHGIDWPPRGPEDGGGRPAPVSPMMRPGGSERSGAAPRSTSPRAPRQSVDTNQTTPNISDLIEVDKYGRAHRGIKRSDIQKGDGRYLSNYEIEMIRANRDLIREDLPSRMIQSRLAGAIAVALANEAERRPAEVPEPEKQGDRPAKKQRGRRVGAKVLPLAVKMQRHQGKRPNQASHRKAA